jgi:hypothetical protein
MPKRIRLILTVLTLSGTGVQGQDRGTQGFWEGICAETLKALTDSAITESDQSEKLSNLRRCGEEGATILAAEMRRMGSRTDLAEMNRSFISISHGRHPLILEAALTLVTDKGATTPGRIAALRLFLRYHDGRYGTTFDRFLPDEGRAARGFPICNFVAFGSHSTTYDMAPLPEGWRSEVQTVLRSIEDDAVEPPIMRDGAHCVLRYLSR